MECRIDVTAIAHHSVPGQPAMHLHVHVYVERSAAVLLERGIAS